jgi:hypothetical protein
MEDKSKLLDYSIAEITEADEIVNAGDRRIPGSVNGWCGPHEASGKAADVWTYEL